ncbi:hypothetical protein KP79_PYT00380 [Mizuhopecten yessoensis]|uniref:TIR domain-containing protein n=1 Tax=Mizuhopecten yessoensis TaxID=6573 RepID=A0A210QZG2_MIZYE|nr:hypothetical protein KP79_PYT00380 [Mizuhopecten yessoensis]
MSGESYDFYICNHEADNDKAFQILETLEKKNGLKGFHDERDAQPGQYVIRNIEKAIESSRFILLVLSEQSMEDGWFEMKLNTGLTHRLFSALRDSIIPVYVAPSDGELTVPTALNSIRGIDYSEDPRFFDKLSKIF